MSNEYLETLGLNEGASKEEVKKAYRRLSKVYHPDVSNDEHAKQKFIAINEAYKFLMLVGPDGTNFESRKPTTSYSYDVQHHDYEELRRKARAYAWKQAREAERRQQELTKRLLKYFDLAMVLVLSLNLFLLLDDRLEVVQTEENIVGTNIFDVGPRNYDELILERHHFKFDFRTLDPLRRGGYRKVLVSSSPIGDIPKYVDIEMAEGVQRYDQHTGVLGFFGFLIEVILLSCFLYKVVVKTLDMQLTMAVVIVFAVVIQLMIFLLS